MENNNSKLTFYYCEDLGFIDTTICRHEEIKVTWLPALLLSMWDLLFIYDYYIWVL